MPTLMKFAQKKKNLAMMNENDASAMVDKRPLYKYKVLNGVKGDIKAC